VHHGRLISRPVSTPQQFQTWEGSFWGEHWGGEKLSKTAPVPMDHFGVSVEDTWLEDLVADRVMGGEASREKGGGASLESCQEKKAE